jgi:hypothetical protein
MYKNQEATMSIRTLVDESLEHDACAAIKKFFDDITVNETKPGKHIDRKEKHYTYAMARAVIDLIKYGGVSDVEEALKYSMIKTGIKLETGNDRIYQDWHDLLRCLVDYNGRKNTIPNVQEIYALLTGNNTFETNPSETRLTFARADLLFDHYVQAGSYAHVSLIENGAAIRDYKGDNTEERSVRYEVLNSLGCIVTKPERITYMAMDAQDNYVFYQDPGHGWLEVPTKELKAMGLEERITPYSYQYQGKVYLEEDDDAQTFLDIRKLLPMKYAIQSKIIDYSCFIRNYSPYRPENLLPESNEPAIMNSKAKDNEKQKSRKSKEMEFDFGR